MYLFMLCYALWVKESKAKRKKKKKHIFNNLFEIKLHSFEYLFFFFVDSFIHFIRRMLMLLQQS